MFLTIFVGIFLCLLKNVEIVILLTCNKGKDVRQQVLKALANPSRIFYVPYSLAVMNFAVQFLIFIGLFIVDLTINGTSAKLNPLYFLISVIVVHSLLAVFSKREPQLGQIISARIRLYKSRIPGRLIA